MHPTPSSVVPSDSIDPPGEVVVVYGPASLSNLGPGFDTLGLCLAGRGDRIEAWLRDEPGVAIEMSGTSMRLPLDPEKNTAGRAAQLVLAQTGAGAGVRLRIEKGIPLGSGVGGSAASAVAGAWAVNELLGVPLSKDELVEAVLEAECVASGAVHGDNVLPALFGGLVLVSPENATVYRRIPLPRALPIAVLLPQIEVATREARAMLAGRTIPLQEAVHNASDLAFLLEAFRAGDWQAVGERIMRDRFVEPVRATLIPPYARIREAALAASAFGCALTGSGPAMFAIAETAQDAARACEAMVEACRDFGVEASGFVAEADLEGVRRVVEEEGGSDG